VERILSGLGVSPGIAIGPASVGDEGLPPVIETSIAEPEIPAEQARFAEAVAVSLKQLRKLRGRAAALPGSAAGEVGHLLEAHLAMLSGSRLIRGVEARIESGRINAERAVEIEIDAIAAGFAAMADPYLAARVEDIRLVGARLVRNLVKKPYSSYSALPEGSIILAEELSPADAAHLDPQRIAGFATEFGGAESHTAIIARALGLPAVLAIPALRKRARGGEVVIIDGGAGAVVLIPPWVLHRHRRLWANPEAFDPERFLPGAPPPDRFAYLPFGLGPRTCIGAQFALTEATIVLARLAQAFRIEREGSEPILPVAAVTLRPRGVYRFRLKPREEPPAAL
jgi:phosphotransferase system enzyme I (PtsI)